MNKLIYPKLSYSIMGILFRVHRKLGNSYKEIYYQRAIAIEFDMGNIPYKQEVYVRINYEGRNVGKQFVDFTVDDKIALEIKTVPLLRNDYYKQLLSYLDSLNYKLGILANFRTERLSYKRLINPKVKI